MIPRCFKDRIPLLHLEDTRYYLCPRCGLWYAFSLYADNGKKKGGFGVYDAKGDTIILPKLISPKNANL